MIYNKDINLRGYNNGYLYFIDQEHPLATGNSGRVYYHRHQASLSLVRWISRDEQVHHIDGNRDNNNQDNLLVCTAKEHAHLHKGKILPKACQYCSTIFIGTSTDQIYCSPLCSSNGQIKNKTVTKEILDTLIPITSWVALGKMFGYSDVGIKKRAKALGCNIPTRNSRA